MAKKPTYEELEQRVKELENETFECKREEEAPRRNEGRFSTMFKHMSSGVAVYESVDNGEDFIFRAFNPAAERITRSSRREVLGNRLLDLFPHMDKSGLLGALQRVWKTGQEEHLPPFYYKDEKREGWWENHIYKLPTGEVVALFDDVTESKQAEEALRESETQKQAILDASIDMIMQYDKDLRIVWANKTAAAVVNETPENLIGQKCHQIFQHIDKPCPACPCVKALKTGNIEYANMYQPAMNAIGESYWDNFAVPLKDEFDQVIAIIEIARNVSQHKRAEEALRESAKEYRSTLNDLLVGVVVHGSDTGILLSNPEAMNILGLTYEQMSGKKAIDPAWNFLHEDSTVMEVEDYPVSRVFSTKKTIHNYILGINRPDRDYVTWVIVNAIPVFFNDNELEKVVVNFVDITSQKQAEEAMRESEKKYRRIFENIQDVYYDSSLDGTILEISPSIENISQYKRKELIGKSLYDIYTDPKARDEFLKLILDKGKVNDFEISLTDKDGSQHPCSITTLLVKDEQNNPIKLVGSMRDISERKQNEEERKKLKAQLQQAQKMEAMGTLAGGIAHDFNNLLMAIQGRTSIVLMNKDSSHPDFRHMKGIEDNVESAADLTKQLLGFARGGKYEVKPTDLNGLIKKENRMFGRTKKEISIRGKYEKDLWSVEVDQGQISQVLLNLYVNAWQAMPAGGDLYLETENVTLDENYLKPFSIEPGKYVKISVTDTGVGMDKATQEKIFEPFFTTKEMGRGTGLGLASAYGIIKNHGGFINVYSEKGHGATFNIYLPASEKEVIEEKKPVGDTLRGTETVLLVDDEDMIIEVAKEVLEHLGYKVLIAGNGKEAIETYEKNKEQIAIVLLDMIMPNMSGSDTYDRMKGINPKIKVLLSSGYSMNGTATEIMDRGCSGFIQKPFKMKELSQKLREILDEK